MPLVVGLTWSPGAARHGQMVCRKCRSQQTMERTKLLKMNPVVRRRINAVKHQSPSYQWHTFLRRTAKGKAVGIDKLFFLKVLREPCLFCSRRTKDRQVTLIDPSADAEPDNVTAVCKVCHRIRVALGRENMRTEELMMLGDAVRTIWEKRHAKRQAVSA